MTTVVIKTITLDPTLCQAITDEGKQCSSRPNKDCNNGYCGREAHQRQAKEAELKKKSKPKVLATKKAELKKESQTKALAVKVEKPKGCDYEFSAGHKRHGETCGTTIKVDGRCGRHPRKHCCGTKRDGTECSKPIQTDGLCTQHYDKKLANEVKEKKRQEKITLQSQSSPSNWKFIAGTMMGMCAWIMMQSPVVPIALIE